MIPAGTLDKLLQRSDALQAAMADPAKSGGDAFAKLSKEYAEISPVIEGIHAYRKLEREIADLEELSAGADAEMQALATDELPGLRTALQRSEEHTSELQ